MSQALIGASEPQTKVRSIPDFVPIATCNRCNRLLRHAWRFRSFAVTKMFVAGMILTPLIFWGSIGFLIYAYFS
ncbi:hypothetical protein RLEG3_20635 [Rhizobium leguminosarum bv. trifolii WSM1689]|nr:hypothetical protein RLEG3_20635 [Rhizobium leguminosarum bv. trifolii WSM1689]